VGHKPGRPNLLPTPHAVAYFLAEEQVRELVEEFGWPVFAAAEKVAPQWGLSAKTLASYCSGRSGYSRKHR
jgi:hypothetical protein